MTANQQADELELKLDRSDSFGSPGYEDFELSSVLTEAQQLFVKKYFDELNNKKSKGFQETEIRRQGLGALIKNASNSSSSSQVGVLDNGVFYDLPADFMYTIYEECTINKKECSTDNYIKAYVTPISYNEIQRFVNNKYKKPFYKSYGTARVWRVEFSRVTTGITTTASAKRHEIITDGTFNVTDYRIRYVKNPLNIVVDRTTPTNQRNCELDESTHTVIIDIAYDLMLQRVKEQKTQTIEPLRELE